MNSVKLISCIALFLSLLINLNAQIIHLSAEEKEWIKQHPKILLGSDDSWAPFIIKDKTGAIVGLDQSFINLLNQKLGTNIELYTGKWSDMVELAKNKQIDGLSTSAPLEKRKEFFRFTEPYMDIYKYIFTRSSEQLNFKSLDELSGKKVGMQKEISFDKNLLSSIKNIEIIETDSVRDSINLLLTKKIDAFIASTEVFPVLQDDVISGVSLSYTVTKPKLNLVFSIRKDWPELVSIINKGLTNITSHERQEIFTQWLGINQEDSPIKESIYNLLSEKEQLWLKNNPKITLGFTDSYTPEVIKESSGIYGGMVFELFSLIESVSGLKIDIEIGEWEQIQEKALKGELDGIALGITNEKRMRQLIFSHPLYEIQSAFYYKTNEPFNSIEKIRSKKIVYIKGERHAENFIKKHNMEFTKGVDNAFNALKDVSSGKYDLALLPTTTGNYLVSKYFLNELSMLPANNKSAISIGIHKTKPELMNIINKTIQYIEPSQFNLLYANWFGKGVTFPSDISYPMFNINELNHLSKKQSVKLGLLPFQEPVLISKNNIKEGIIPDYIKLLSKKLNKSIELFPMRSKKEIQKAMKEGRIDGFIFNTPKAELHKNITKSLVNIPLVLATKEETPFFDGLIDNDLKKLAIPQRMQLKDMIKHSYKHIEFVDVENAVEGLNALLKNKVDAYICSPNVISYTLRSHDIPNIKISGITPYSVDMVVKISKEQPELLSIFDKAVGSISNIEHQDIRMKWRQVELQVLPDYTYYFQLVTVLFIVIFGITLWISWWNQRLRYEIKQKEIAQKDASEKERQLSALLNNIHGMAYRAKNEPDWPMIEVNRASYELTGYTQEEFLNQSILFNDVIIESDRERIWDEVQDALDKKTGYYIEYRIKTKSGEIKWVWEKGLPVYSEEEGLLWLEGLIVDNTQIKQIELAIKESEQRLRTLLNTIPDMVWMKDKQGVYVACNLKYQKFLNIPESEIIGKTDYDFYEKERASFYRKNDQLAIEAGKPRANEEDAVYSDGYVARLETVKAPVYDASNNLIGVIGIGRDITELKNKEEMLISQSRHAAMGEMIGMIAHQWRQPLSVISMYANNIIADIELESLEEKDLKNTAQDVLRHTKELSKTIDDFRNFFKPDKKLQKSDIQDILSQTFHIVSDSLKNNQIKIIQNIDSNTKVVIYPRELMQVFVNIITNAKDALVLKNIEHKKITISVYEDHKYLHIEILDNAQGIKEEILQKVFEPYFTTKGDSSGTGLGLYMSKMIIEEHLKGKLQVENKEDGACFTISLLKEI